MANTYVMETLNGATFYDATTKACTTLSGSGIAEYDAVGNLVSVFNPSVTITPTTGAATTWNAGSGSGALNQIHATGSSNAGACKNLYVDYNGAMPTTLNGGATATAGTALGTSTSVTNVATGNTDFLSSTGAISGAVDNAVTTTIRGAVFAEGSTLTGTWTAIHDASGTRSRTRPSP